MKELSKGKPCLRYTLHVPTYHHDLLRCSTYIFFVHKSKNGKHVSTLRWYIWMLACAERHWKQALLCCKALHANVVAAFPIRWMVRITRTALKVNEFMKLKKTCLLLISIIYMLWLNDLTVQGNSQWRNWKELLHERRFDVQDTSRHKGANLFSLAME